MRTLFFDVDTQLDFMCPGGSLYVPGAESIISQLAALTSYAKGQGVTILSSVDAHTEDDPEFQKWPPHCVIDTVGQEKLSVTRLPKPAIVSSLPGELPDFNNPKQIIIEKQTLDAFSNPNLRTVLDLLKPGRVVVYGVVSELCVQCAAFGLLRLGYQVELVTDAIKSLNSEHEQQTLQRFQQQGGVLTTCGAVVASSASA